MLNFFQILILALIQGACELLPVSSSAHVIVAEKLMGLDPASPEMTMLLVMLHTGTMFAVIVYFWRGWRRDYLASAGQIQWFAILVIAATACTGIIGVGLKILIEKVFMRGSPHAEIENLFDNLPLMAGALAAVGLLIIYAGLREEKQPRHSEIQMPHSLWIGLPALPRFLPVGRHHFHGIAPRFAQTETRGIQFCPGRCAHPGRHRAGSSSPPQGACTERTRFRAAFVFARLGGHGLEFHRRFARPKMALPMAGRRPLEILWLLLPGRRRWRPGG